MAATYVKPGELGLNPEKLTEMLTELETIPDKITKILEDREQYLSTV